MPNSSDILEVTAVAGKRVHRHPCSGFHVDERGNLVIGHDNKTVGAYAAGHWIRALRTGNEIEKATAKEPPQAPGKAPSEMAAAAQATRAQGRARPRRRGI